MGKRTPEYRSCRRGIRSIATVWNRIQAKIRTGEDLKLAAISLKLLFAHYEEIRLTAANEKTILSPASRIADDEISPEAVNHMRRLMELHGAIVSQDDVRGMILVSRERKENGVRKIRESGLVRCHKEAVAFLNRRATQLSPAVSHAGHRMLWAAANPQITREECDQMQAVIDAMVLTAAMNGLACAVGCAPCCAIAAGIYLTAALLQTEKNAACADIAT